MVSMMPLVDAEACRCRSGEPGEHGPGCENHPGFNLMPEGTPIPKLYAQENKGGAAVVYVKLFLPVGGWTWYLTEYDPEDDVAFGLVVGHATELGYVALQELRDLRVGPGLRVERDLWWRPTPLGEVRAAL